jgi:hypothetical protein
MRHQLILVIGLVMVSCLPGEAQTPAKQILLAQAPPSPMMVFFRRSPPIHSSPTVFLTIDLPPKSRGRFTSISTATYGPERSLESRLSIVVDQSPFVTYSSMPVAQLWGGRLQLDGFGSTLGTQYVQFGPLGIGRDFRPPSHDQAGLNPWADLYGLRLRIDFGKAQTGRPTQIWRCLGWIVGKGNSCPL